MKWYKYIFVAVVILALTTVYVELMYPDWVSAEDIHRLAPRSYYVLAFFNILAQGLILYGLILGLIAFIRKTKKFVRKK